MRSLKSLTRMQCNLLIYSSRRLIQKQLLSVRFISVFLLGEHKTRPIAAGWVGGVGSKSAL